MTAFGSTVELRLNASGNCAAKRGLSFPNETEGCARRKRGSWLVQSHYTPGTSVRWVFLRGTRRLVTCHARCHGGARICQRTYERDAPAGRSLVSWENNTHLSPKVRRFTPHGWSNGRQPPTATCGNARDQPPSQRHAAWKLHSIVRNREGDDEWSRPEGPVASLPARIAFGSSEENRR